MKEENIQHNKIDVKGRDALIVRTSIISIAANVLLAGFKAAIGILTHSIAITLDAVNNLSDALSSIITIIGTKLAGKPADRKHPYGHGRVEYLSATIISAIVLYAGVASLKESVEKIIHPEAAVYTTVSLVIVAAAVVVKILLGVYVQSVGKKANSKSLVASGLDARNDAVISASVLATAILMKMTGISLEAYVGVVISILILKSGIDMMRDTLSDILGARVPTDVSKEIKETIRSHENVFGAYDLVLHSYGPDHLQGSVHVEVPDTMTADEIDRLSTDIAVDVYQKHHVILSAVGIYSRNSQNPKAKEARADVLELLQDYREVIQMHGFYLDEERKTIKFDTVVSFEAEDRRAVCDEIRDKVQAMYPEYSVHVNLDADISD